MRNKYLIYIIISGLLFGSFFGAFIHNIGAVPIDEKDFSLVGYKEKAELGDKHILNIGFDKTKLSFVDSDINYKLVGNATDIKVFKDCVDVSFYVKDGVIFFSGIVKKYGVYSVDVQPVIKGLTVKKYAWWNSSFLYYKVLNIANKILGYQMRLSLGNSSTGNVSCGGHIKQGDYFKDVRFVNSANTTEYYHWMENVTTGVNAVFWINNSNNASSFIMYYGCQSCSNSTYRNGNLTFYFFDGFYGVSLDSTKWTSTTGSGGTITVSDGAVSLYVPVTANAVSKILGKTAFGYGYSIRTRTKVSLNLVLRSYKNIGFCNSGITKYSMFNWQSNVKLGSYSNIGEIIVSPIPTENVFHLWEVKRTSLGITYDVDNGKVGYHTGLLADSINAVFDVEVSSTASGSAVTVTVDWIFIRKYINVSSPYWSSFGGETVNSPPALSLLFPVNNSIDVSLMPTVLVWCNDTDTNLLNILFQTNYTGSWVSHQTNNSFTANNKAYWNYVESYTASKKYWLRVYVYDGVTNVTHWYCFTTIANGTISTNFTFEILYPLDNERDICPCCIVFGVNVSNDLGENMTLTFSNNDTGDFEVISNIPNGSYYFMYCDFNLFDWLYDWWVTVDAVTNSTVSDYQHFYTSSDVNCSSSVSGYTKTESDDLFLSGALSIEPNLLFLTIVLSLWLYFVSKYFDKKEIIFAEIQFGLSMPLTLSLAVFSFNYPLGFIITMLTPIFAIWILIDGFLYSKNNNK